MTNSFTRVSLIILCCSFFLSFFHPALFAYSQMPEFICELGIKAYQQGNYELAKHEFKKALLIKPDYEPALRYLQMIEQLEAPPQEGEEQELLPPSFEPSKSTPEAALSESMDLIELQREVISERRAYKKTEYVPPGEARKEIAKEAALPKIIGLDDSLSASIQPIEIEQGRTIIVTGKNIRKFLVTQEGVIIVEQDPANPDQLLVTGKNIGYTYLYAWDDNGRWETEFLTVLQRPEGPTYAELMRRAAEVAHNFKLRYTMDWSSYETGNGIPNWERTTYSWAHRLNLTGETPYGNLDAAVNFRKQYGSVTSLTYGTIGLTDGQLGNFKDFSLRGLDYTPSFSNLSFPGATLRGGMLDSPAFNNKLSYTLLWGREGGGRYGDLSPALSKPRDSYLAGFNLSYLPTLNQNYKVSLVRGYGTYRKEFDNLKDYSYDMYGSWNYKPWDFNYELAYDTQHLAELFRAIYSQPKLKFSMEMRDVDKDFSTILGYGWARGELGWLFNLDYTPTEKLNLTGSMDIYKDRLFPAEDKPTRLNEDFNFDLNYQADELTSAAFRYTLQNDLGTISQRRYQSPGIYISRRIRFIRDISTYLSYYHQKNQSFNAPASDYVNNQVSAGLGFRIIGELAYYLREEYNWLRETSTGNRSLPNALETGLTWSDKLGSFPLYGDVRFTYRNEEDATSPLSFLSGQDYIEGYAQLSYRPTNDKEIFGSCRIRNVWADKSTISKRIEGDFNAGVRYLWDTGLHWEPVGTIEGYIFKDFNSDGLRQRDEVPAEGIKVWLGKDKSALTDIFGYYEFKGIRARKAYVTLDTTTLPPGFVLTVPVTQEVAIGNHRISRIDFGIASHSEITGFIFEDANGNGQYDSQDKGLQGVVVMLDAETKTATDASGKYSFSNIATGEHALNIDLNSIPAEYIPTVPITKTIVLFEGVSYIYNIPLKRTQE